MDCRILFYLPVVFELISPLNCCRLDSFLLSQYATIMKSIINSIGDLGTDLLLFHVVGLFSIDPIHSCRQQGRFDPAP